MSFWQRFAVVLLGLAAGVAIQLLIKDPDARAGLTGLSGTLIGWMMRAPGDAAKG